jgi:hypothetical protein
MSPVVWLAVFGATALVGVALAVRGSSRSWRIAGVAFALGGAAVLPYALICLVQGWDGFYRSSAGDAALTAATVGFVAIFAGLVFTLIALGRLGRRRFLVVFAALTLAIGVLQFWTSNWTARMGDVPTHCSDRGHDFRPGLDRIERMPPGVRCADGRVEVLVPPDALSWLALAGWSVYYAFLATFPLMALAWAARRRPTLRLA